MLNTAIIASKEAGRLSLEFFNKEKVINFKENGEIVTDMDLIVEKAIKSIIRKKFPDHSFLTEEEGEENNDSEYLWVIDPIDGTFNYSRGISPYCISIALLRNREIILGVVYNPVTNELFRAEKGKGAFLNDSLIKVSEIKNLSKSLIYSSELSKINRYISSLIKSVGRLRVTSASAYEICLVACGKVEGFIKKTDYFWNAASYLIVKEAGGCISDFRGNEWKLDTKEILITNKWIKKDLIQVIMNI
jgi:myo-inositol-1(or 4)-monophosphatase